MIDLDALRRVIGETHAAPGAAATVSRRFLEQVEQELREGRAARAELSMQRGMAHVVDKISSGRW